MPRLSFLINLYFLMLPLAPIVCMFDHYSINQGFRKIYGATILLLGVLILLRKGIKECKIGMLSLLAFCVYCYYLIWDIVLWQGAIARKGFVYDFFTNPYLHIAFLIFVVDNFKISKELLNTIIVEIKYVLLIAFAVTLVQLLKDPFFLTPDDMVESAISSGMLEDVFDVRRVSIFGFSNVLDISLSLIPLLAIYTSDAVINKKSLPYIVVLVGMVIAFANNSRYLQVAFFFCLVPFAIEGRNKWRNALIVVLSIPFLILLSIQVLEFFEVDVEGYIQGRLLSASAGTRILAWEIFNQYFWDRPFFGTGVHLTDQVVVALAGRSSQIHVGYLAHLFSYGLIGSLLVFGFWGSIIYRFYVTARNTGFWGSFLGFLGFLWANVTLVYYNIFLHGIMLAFLFDAYYRQKNMITEKEKI
ncbi:O-antigen ligase domain-containing protein [Marinilabiliaceae bacterium JC017]|nr:O-antigen ligase domain-containing protein [Marinilabiliaceae bacterium JC017]